MPSQEPSNGRLPGFARSFSGDYRALYEAAVAQGFRVSLTGSGHVKWVAPCGAFCFSPGTSSDRRAFFQVRSKLRRIGLQV